MIHTVKFNKPVVYTNGLLGVTFTKDGADPQTIAPDSVSGSGTDVIEYNVPWDTAGVDPVVGDVVEWHYDGGDYEDQVGATSVLHMNGDSYIDIPVAPDKDSEGRLEIEFNLDNVVGTKAVFDSQTSVRNLLLTAAGELPRARIFSSVNLDQGSSLVDGVWYKSILDWGGFDTSATNFNLSGDVVSGTQTAAAAGNLRLGNRDSLSIPIFGYIKNLKLYDAITGGALIGDWRIDDNVADAGVIKNYADPSGATDGVLTLGGSSVWETAGIPMENQVLQLVNCKGTFTASLYQGTKTTDTTVRTEPIATGVTNVLIESNAGTGTVTVLNNGVVIGTVADGDIVSFSVSAGTVSWSSVNAGTIELGQGKS